MAWTDIADSLINTNDWITSGVMTQLCDNEQYNYDTAVRTGTTAAGDENRLALARGRTKFEVANIAHPFYTPGDDVGVAGNVVFATDSMDGDPNFKDESWLPMVMFTIEDYYDFPATDTYWYDDDIWVKHAIGAEENKWYVVPYPPTTVKTTGLSSKGFSYQLYFNTTARRKIMGYLNWVAIAPVNTGE